MASDPRRVRTPIVLGLVILAVTALTVVQIRSQAEVQRSLVGQDNTSLAFLIDELHQSNEALAAEEAMLTAQREQLRAGGGGEVDAQLRTERQRLEVIEGLVPVTGPGVTLMVDAALNEVDLQDAVNNLRVAGAEAVAIDGHRVVTGTVIQRAGGIITIDGSAGHGPWQFDAIGSPIDLPAAAEQMTRTLRADPRVRSAGYATNPSLVIGSVVRQRPFVYALSQ
ncbi:MAG: hypothetical protein NVS9B1_24630 [Candidatus Dormibacteraceae bacterium]